MATAKLPKSAQEETITCSICQEILQQPRRLDCLHSFCNKCLKNVDRVTERGRRGVLCPLCRKFTSEPHIKKDPILEVLVEGFAEFYDKNILNKGPMDKSCSQCDRKINVIYFCEDCELELCQKCENRHRRFKGASEHRIVPIAEAGTHPVVNVTQYCPKHPSKPIKVSCVPCKLAICLECKVEDHDTHKTEDINTALSSVLPEVRASCPVLEAERSKQIEGKQELASLVSNLTHVGEQIVNSAAKARDDVISKARRDFNEIRESVTNHIHAVRKEASLREDGLNNSISSIQNMTCWINVLADMAQGSAVLYEVRNENLLERIQNLLAECKQTRDVREFRQMAETRPIFTKTHLNYENVIGKVSFGEHLIPHLESVQAEKHSLSTKPASTPKHTPSAPGAVAKVKRGTDVSPLRGEVRSLRHTESKLWGAECENRRSFKLERKCRRFIHHQGSLWCPCPENNALYCYTPAGTLQTSIRCEGVSKPNSLHPLSATHMMLAADSGLYVYNTAKQAVSTKLVEGRFWDVHGNGEDIVALEKRKSRDTVCVFSTTDPPTQTHSFSVKHCNATSVIVHKQRVYVSAYGKNTSVSVFTLKGQLLSQWGSKGDSAPGEMYNPQLCGVDSEDCLLIADCENHRVQLMNSSGEFSVMRGVEVEYPWYVAVVGRQLLVLHGYPEIHIQTYQIR